MLIFNQPKTTTDDKTAVYHLYLMWKIAPSNTCKQWWPAQFPFHTTASIPIPNLDKMGVSFLCISIIVWNETKETSSVHVVLVLVGVCQHAFRTWSADTVIPESETVCKTPDTHQQQTTNSIIYSSPPLINHLHMNTRPEMTCVYTGFHFQSKWG